MKPDAVDLAKCTACGLCTEQCKSGVLLINENKNRLELYDKDCLECSHCIAVCPEKALSAHGIYPDEIKSPPKPDDFLKILNARRSVRNYLDKEVENAELELLAEYARFAPTGSNTQGTNVAFVKSLETRKKVTRQLMKFYKRVNTLVSIWPIRMLLYLFLPTKEAKKLRQDLKRMIKRYENGHDILFHNSPVLIFVYYLKGKSRTPKDDGCYALYNMVLGAESMGLGTCINQLAVIAYKTMKKKVGKILGLPKKARIHVSSSLGYPVYKYHSAALREEAKFKII